jgi:hypothetical protein
MITKEHIENIYQGVPPISDAEVRLTSGYDSKSLINIFDNEIQMNNSEIIRYYHDNYPLIASTRSGKVASHFLFVLNNDYRGRGIATNIHDKEYDTYLFLGFEQIQLKASWDGVIVWKKLDFEYKYSSSEDTIIAKWKEYINSELGYSGKDFFDIIKNITTIDQIKRKYLRPVGAKSFTDWLNEQDIMQEVPMYKNVA